MKMSWKRTLYFSIGAIFCPIFLALSILTLSITVHGARGQRNLPLYGVAALLCFIAVVAGSAFRAAFRNPPWWIITPEKTRQSEALLIKRQILKNVEKQLKASKNVLRLAKQLEKLKITEPDAPLNDRGGRE